MIGIIATFDVKDGMQAEFETLGKAMMSNVKANEAGCSTYQLYRQKGSQSVYIFMEQYSSREALAAHGQTEYMKSIGPKFGPCLNAPPKIEQFELIE